MSSRFDYVKYDDKSNQVQAEFKGKMLDLELQVELKIQCPRSRAEAHKKLEEFYMWVGKGIRNDQLARTPHTQLQEERGNA